MYRSASTASRKPPKSKHMIDMFLAEAKALRDRCPTVDELKRAKRCLQELDAITRVDHLRTIDELLAQVPNEFAAAIKQLENGEKFVLLAAAGEPHRVKRRLEADWELISAVDRDGHTALHSAAACDNVEVATLLLDHGAKPNAQDYEGFTPLHWAVENNSLAVAGLLLEAGASTHLRTTNHRRAIDFIADLKSKHQANMERLFTVPREGCAAFAAALARGEATLAEVGGYDGGGGGGDESRLGSAPGLSFGLDSSLGDFSRTMPRSDPAGTGAVGATAGSGGGHVPVGSAGAAVGTPTASSGAGSKGPSNVPPSLLVSGFASSRRGFPSDRLDDSPHTMSFSPKKRK